MFLTSFSASAHPGWRMLVASCFTVTLTAGCIVVDRTDERAGDAAAADGQDAGGEPERERARERASARDDVERTAEPGFLERVFDRGPDRVTVPSGTAVAVRFLDTASSHDSVVGQAVAAEVVADVAVGGEVAIPAGSTVIGRVAEAHQPGIGGQARLRVDFASVELRSGASAPLMASVSAVGKSEKGKDAATIIGGAAAGAVLGHQVDDGDAGKVVGGAVGGGIGTAIAKRTKGQPVVIPAGTVVDLELRGPVTVQVRS